eukprot:6963635-Pyramimonas_sp.AAC.1
MKGHNQHGRETIRTFQRGGRQEGERRGRTTGRRGGGEDDEMSVAILVQAHRRPPGRSQGTLYDD